MDGILIADKPKGMSSAQLVARIKRWCGFKKAGHAGTLDPFATGVMLVLVNRATRLAGFFLNGEKCYRGILRLGVETDSQDATGRIIRQRPVPDDLELDAVYRMAAGFIGEQEQYPPVFSALKHHGVPLYKLARHGKPVQKPARRIRIHALDVESVDLPDIQFHVRCSAGTYIRTLATDMGNALGCGGHLVSLRRTASGRFGENSALGLPDIQRLAEKNGFSDQMVSMADALQDLPGIRTNPALTEKLKYGKILSNFEVAETIGDASSQVIPTGNLKILDEEGALIAILHHDSANGTIQYVVNFMIQPSC